MHKNILILFTFTLICYTTQAQFKSSFASIKPQLTKVINDFPYNYHNIRGNVLNEGEPNTAYVSKVEIKNAIETKIVAYSNQKILSWVWETSLIQTEDLKELQRIYKAYYNDISGNALFKNGVGGLVAVSPYVAPTETLRFWSNQLRMQNDVSIYRNLVVDLVAEYTNFQWTVYLRVYDKEKDEEVGPTEKN